MLTMKFGGTSVGDAAAIRRVADIVYNATKQHERIVVVASAMTGVTNTLIKAARTAETQNDYSHHRVKEDLLYRHRHTVSELVADEFSRMDVVEEIEMLLEDFDSLCHAVYILGELTPRGLDAIASLGERMAVRLVAARLKQIGIPAQVLEATEIILTDDTYNAAIPFMTETQEKTRAALSPLLAQGIVPVVTGFIGATREGIVTTLGRGGSDYTAAIVGAALDSDEIWIWTDVDGVMTADPRVVPDACTLPEISYKEAAKLACFGARVLHPKTILPAIEKGIPIWVKNTFNPEGAGTLIAAKVEQSEDTCKMVTAITAIKGVSMVNVDGSGMIGVPGIAAKVFTAVADEGISVLMILQSASEQNICFVIPTDTAPRAIKSLRDRFARDQMSHYIDKVWAQDNIALIIAVLGADMRDIPGITARAFGMMGERGINVISITQGSAERNISFVVAEHDAEEAMRQLHSHFALAR